MLVYPNRAKSSTAFCVATRITAKLIIIVDSMTFYKKILISNMPMEKVIKTLNQRFEIPKCELKVSIYKNNHFEWD